MGGWNSLFTHLHVHSPYSFLDGASAIAALVKRAAELDMDAIAITDHSNLSATVQLHKSAFEHGLKPITGAELVLDNGSHLIALAPDARAYGYLCQLLTRAYVHGTRKNPIVCKNDLEELGADLLLLSGCRQGEIPRLILQSRYHEAKQVAQWYQQRFPHFYLELNEGYLPGSKRLYYALEELASTLGLELVLTGNVHYAGKEDFFIHDILTCVRTLTHIDQVHPERRLNAENYLQSPDELLSSFPQFDRAMAVAGELGDRCQPVLSFGKRLHPHFPARGESAVHLLKRLVKEGARERYGRIAPRLRERIAVELDVIIQLGYEDYFLLVWDVIRFAQKRGIRHSGRGSAADSVVAYCLGITEVDAYSRGLLFERFMSLERRSPPDIDVDFDARYRDQVSDYVYKRYGKEHVATVCTYNTFRARSALRDLGKALGFAAEELDVLAKRLPMIAAHRIDEVWDLPELRGFKRHRERLSLLLEGCRRVAGHPRHLGTHLGGLVISRTPLLELTPLQPSAKGVLITQFDKEDVEDLGLIKLDLLSLRTLGAVSDTLQEVGMEYGEIPPRDRKTYQMLNAGQTIGVFQLESPAQRQLQVRLQADHFEDLVASVALIRPGPIKGNMVKPFIARRQGLQPVTYVDERLRKILAKTYGVVLFQEQVIEIAHAIAGFTPGEADQLRRVMTHGRSAEEMEKLGERFVEKSVAGGHSLSTAQYIFSLLKSYASYGFCEAHAASFASIAYKTAYLTRYHPAEFYAALLAHGPMGYYPASSLCVEARRRGIEVKGPAINSSHETARVESGAIQLGLEQVKGMTEKGLEEILRARKMRRFSSLFDFVERSQLPKSLYESLILCGSADEWCGGNRRQLLWELEDARQGRVSDHLVIGDFTLSEKLEHEHAILGLSVSAHPLQLVRDKLKARGVRTVDELSRLSRGRKVRLAGYPIRPHRPPTRSGKVTVFFSLEDETGLAEITVFEAIYQKCGQHLFGEKILPVQVEGTYQGRPGAVVASDITLLSLSN